jgi:hypothetical protein
LRTAGDVFEVDGGMLWVGDEAVACSEAGVEAATCSKAGDETAVCSRTRIEDGRQRRCGSV